MLSPMASDAGVNFWIYLFIFSLILLPFSFFISGILMLMGKHTAWARMAPWIVIVLVALGALGWELT